MDTYNSYLDILKTYMTAVTDGRIPTNLAYVSAVQGHNFTVTYFSTSTFRKLYQINSSEKEYSFDFASQEFRRITLPIGGGVTASGGGAFVAHMDDGDLEMECDAGTTFNGEVCARQSLCLGRNINIPLTENALNTILFDKMNARRKPTTNNLQQHATVYVHCDDDLVPHIRECGNGETFVGNQCQYDPVITTNGRGLTTDINYDKIKGKKSIMYYGAHAAYKLHTKFGVATTKQYTTTPPPPTQHTTSPNVVNSNHTFNHQSACATAAVGHTFITDELSEHQYMECIGANNVFLHTCVNRYYNNGAYYCDIEEMCKQFERGTGIVVNGVSTDNISFDSGASVCENYQITRVEECDIDDFVVAKRFDRPITARLQLPTQIYHQNKCVDYNVDAVNILKDGFEIIVDDRVSTSMVGRVSKIPDKQSFLNARSIGDFVTYSRDLGEIGIDDNLMGLDCFGAVSSDIFDNTRYNECQNDQLVRTVPLNNNQYVEDGVVKTMINYTGQCRMEDGASYFDQAHRVVGDFQCYYTIPKSDNVLTVVS